ncbi:MAG: Lrp/AsnC family transcriptional regulator [Thermococcus sp.]|uniref:Transcriptional regulator n=1 Tax=Thermococcus guaymasensis DSM 11113 TaxID=1432656 RepID=A0A0X1KKL8_9EURY|nr:Lrp/AsnC family transcriptional regulator [Thermococcus guaymasensis]AJC71809.1 transcriptional regulator [Thermococcus guaymasensis DSM 11113]MCD6524837.1 Lrp/AsnC family transcriptional regulator [Thermococcus sp.]
MPRKVKIDPVDIKIVRLLSENARLTYKELAEAIGTTRQRISRRMNKLEKMGIVQKYTVIPDYEALGYSHIVLGITLKPGAKLDDVVSILKDKEHVKIIQKALGTHNLVVHVVAPKDMKEIQSIIESITSDIKDIDHLDITFITETCKFQTF